MIDAVEAHPTPPLPPQPEIRLKSEPCSVEIQISDKADVQGPFAHLVNYARQGGFIKYFGGEHTGGGHGRSSLQVEAEGFNIVIDFDSITNEPSSAQISQVILDHTSRPPRVLHERSKKALRNHLQSLESKAAALGFHDPDLANKIDTLNRMVEIACAITESAYFEDADKHPDSDQHVVEELWETMPRHPRRTRLDTPDPTISYSTLDDGAGSPVSVDVTFSNPDAFKRLPTSVHFTDAIKGFALLMVTLIENDSNLRQAGFSADEGAAFVARHLREAAQELSVEIDRGKTSKN